MPITLNGTSGITSPSVVAPINLPNGGPAFSATRSGTQSIANATFTKVQYNSEEFDTNSNYDPTTDFRFTPTVAGYYSVNASAGWGFTSGFSISTIYKNGSVAKWGSLAASTGAGTLSTVSVLIYMNGSTDYVESYVYQQAGSSQNITANTVETYFQAALVRAA